MLDAPTHDLAASSGRIQVHNLIDDYFNGKARHRDTQLIEDQKSYSDSTARELSALRKGSGRAQGSGSECDRAILVCSC